jgi:hypothetical protein
LIQLGWPLTDQPSRCQANDNMVGLPNLFTHLLMDGFALFDILGGSALQARLRRLLVRSECQASAGRSRSLLLPMFGAWGDAADFAGAFHVPPRNGGEFGIFQ